MDEIATASDDHSETSPDIPYIDTDTRLKLYRTMVECRVLEQRAYDLFMQNLVKGTSHLALGQEAVAAGFGTAFVRHIEIGPVVAIKVGSDHAEEATVFAVDS